jgi:hypothetical protein
MEAPAGFPTDEMFLHYYTSLESFLKRKWQMMRRPKKSTIRTDIYEIRPRADKHGVDLVSDALPYSPIWYRGSKAIRDAIDHAKFYSRSHAAVIRVLDSKGNLEREISFNQADRKLPRVSSRAAKLQAGRVAREGNTSFQSHSTKTAKRSFETQLSGAHRNPFPLTGSVRNPYDRQNNLRFGAKGSKKVGHSVRL